MEARTERNTVGIVIFFPFFSLSLLQTVYYFTHTLFLTSCIGDVFFPHARLARKKKMRRKIRTREPLYIFVELDINNERDSLVAICAVLLQEWMSFYNKESCAVRNNLASVISCWLACSCPAQNVTRWDNNKRLGSPGTNGMPGA